MASIVFGRPSAKVKHDYYPQGMHCNWHIINPIRFFFITPFWFLGSCYSRIAVKPTHKKAPLINKK